MTGPQRHDEPEATGPASLLCSGFIQVDGRMLAVINGVEYEEGDLMAKGGYTVRQISEEKVVLESLQGEEIVVLIDRY